MNHRIHLKGNIALLLTLAMLLSLFSGCTTPAGNTEQTSQTDAAETTEATVVTEPPATTPADGNPEDVTCQGSYTVDAAQAQSAADTVVAVITVTRNELVEVTPTEPAETEAPTDETVAAAEEATTAAEETEAASEETAAAEETVAATEATEPATEETQAPTGPVYETVTVTEEYPLTNGQLQVWYWLEVAAYRQAGHEVAPDFTQSLDTQVCPIDESVGSWQQYFLREALNTWSESQAMVLQSQLVPLGYEEPYQPNAERHAEYFVDIPAISVYYGSTEYYRPNELHQAYLDNIPTMLSQLATESGCADVTGLAQMLAGPGASETDLTAVTELYNLGYMYLTELTYNITPTAEEVEAYFTEHEAAYAEAGITRDSGKYVDMRHILLFPKGASIADDGTVTAEESRWTNIYWEAQSLLGDIHDTYPYSEGVFATFAANNSADPGSAMNGGLYENLTQGQLTDALDAWLFDDAREAGDTSVIRSDCGMHIVYFCDSTEIWYETAEADLKSQLYLQQILSAQEQYPAQIDYSAICLGEAADPSISVDALLYDDISHERYPVAPLYLQQDYPTTRYGAYPIVTYGCGITTMAMIATYMSDTELTPPTLCARYGRYCTEKGTDRTLFVHTPGDMGFYLKKQVFSSSQALEALQQGYIVVCLQHAGYWTSGGHFLLLEKLNEDGTVQVRDSNLFNYGKLDGHKIDEFEWKTIPANAVSYWIYYPKYTSCSQCIRCDDGQTQGAPEAMFNAEYLCGTCSNALLRRNTYLSN